MKDRIFNVGILFFQIAIAFVVLFVLYMLLAIMDNDFGIEGLLMLTFIQPVLGIALTLGCIMISLVIGLPIRLNTRIRDWWINSNIAVIGIVVGFILILISNVYFLQETVRYKEAGAWLTKTIPNRFTLAIGWCMIGFMCLHVFPDEKLKKKVMYFFIR